MVDAGLSHGELIAECGLEDDWGRQTAEHIAWHNPARVLADVAAKRRIIDLAFQHASFIDDERGCHHHPSEIRDSECPVMVPDELTLLRLLALPHADHEGYRPEWRP